MRQEVCQIDKDLLLKKNLDHKIIYHIGKDNTFSQEYHTPISLEAFFDLFDRPEPISVELNSEYIAAVTEDEIIVGCQRFPHSVVGKLQSAIEKIVG